MWLGVVLMGGQIKRLTVKYLMDEGKFPIVCDDDKENVILVGYPAARRRKYYL